MLCLQANLSDWHILASIKLERPTVALHIHRRSQTLVFTPYVRELTGLPAAQ
jgi:hypothetical protein